LESVRFGEDEDPLDRIDELLDGRSAISFNGAGFDFPVLMLAAQKARNFDLPALRTVATQPRFGNLHYDLAQRYSNFGQARGASLERLCSALGIPAKIDTHGDDVAQLFAQGKIDRISAYCETDVAATLMLFAQQRAMEIGDPAYHAALTYQFVRWIEQEMLDHLTPFADVHDLRELQRQSLLRQLEAADIKAAADADLRAKQALDAAFGDADVIHY
jgi:DNA polymerase elongation subunit (family B)